MHVEQLRDTLRLELEKLVSGNARSVVFTVAYDVVYKLSLAKHTDVLDSLLREALYRVAQENNITLQTTTIRRLRDIYSYAINTWFRKQNLSFETLVDEVQKSVSVSDSSWHSSNPTTLVQTPRTLGRTCRVVKHS